MIAETSYASYHQTTSEREIQEELLMGLYRKRGALTDREACYLLGWEAPSVVSARRDGLRKKGLVTELGRKRAETGKTVVVWGEIKSTLF